MFHNVLMYKFYKHKNNILWWHCTCIWFHIAVPAVMAHILLYNTAFLWNWGSSVRCNNLSWLKLQWYSRWGHLHILTLTGCNASLWWTRWSLEKQISFKIIFFTARLSKCLKISPNQLKYLSVSLRGLISIHRICQSYLPPPLCTSCVGMHVWLWRLIQ